MDDRIILDISAIPELPFSECKKMLARTGMLFSEKTIKSNNMTYYVRRVDGCYAVKFSGRNHFDIHRLIGNVAVESSVEMDYIIIRGYGTSIRVKVGDWVVMSYDNVKYRLSCMDDDTFNKLYVAASANGVMPHFSYQPDDPSVNHTRFTQYHDREINYRGKEKGALVGSLGQSGSFVDDGTVSGSLTDIKKGIDNDVPALQNDSPEAAPNPENVTNPMPNVHLGSIQGGDILMR